MACTWTMPQWMEPYRALIATNGDSVEELMQDGTPWQTNAIRAIVAAGVKYQVGLLTRLHKAGSLIPKPSDHARRSVHGQASGVEPCDD